MLNMVKVSSGDITTNPLEWIQWIVLSGFSASTLCGKCLNAEYFLVCIIQHSD